MKPGQNIKLLEGMKVAILGFDREGRSVLDFISDHPDYHGAEIWVLDKKETIALPENIRSRLGKNYLSTLSDFDVVFRSPGVPFMIPEIQKALKAGVTVSSATKLFFDYCPVPIIGVTGTKGKGTTSTLLYNILRAGGFNAFLCGNIGIPALDLLPKIVKAHIGGESDGDGGKNSAEPIVVFELSSFQLQDLTCSPHIAVAVETFPDHQDAHKDLKEYYSAKANIARYQKRSDKIFYFGENKLSAWIAKHGAGKKIAVDKKKLGLFEPSDLKVVGAHNYKNAIMAASVARSLDVPDEIIVKTVKAFRGTEHRLEFVRTIGTIAFYNDSASTIPQTSASAINSFPGKKVVLIAGGADKGLDYAPLAQTLKKSKTALVVLYGQNKSKIKKSVISAGTPIVTTNTLKEALASAYSHARQLGDTVVVLSPGATSLDMFTNYADRGAQFKALVEKLK
jgi:UDP-N-acetylmuramoylalanine--D-glutamate ligase